MKKVLFGRVWKKLLRIYKKVHGHSPKGHEYSRLRSLASYIVGMLRTKQSHLRALGRGLLSDIDAYSKEKAAKKFLENRWIDYDGFYAPYLQYILGELVQLLTSRHGLYLIIDGSQMGKDHACLMVSIAFGKRSIPIRWTIKKGSKGHFSTKEHVDLLREVATQLQGVLPATIAVTVLGDGEFDSVDLQKLCLSKSWNYVFRTACDTVMYENGDRFQAKQIELEQGQDHLFIPGVEFTAKERLKNVNFLLWHDKRFEQPIPLISNLDEPELIMQAYDRRWAIESLFIPIARMFVKRKKDQKKLFEKMLN